MSASYNPLQTEDQQIEADAAYARRLQAEERRSATTQSPLHDVSEISRNHAAAPQFPKIPSPAKLVEGLSREQTAGAVFAAFVAVKLGLGPAFAQLTCVALGLAVFSVSRKSRQFRTRGGAFRAAFSAAFVLAFVVACVGVTAADVCTLIALGAAATKPQQSSFTGDALKTVLKAERKATRGPKPRDFWGKLTRKFTSAVDDFFATLQDRAADVRFYDCDLFMVCKVTHRARIPCGWWAPSTNGTTRTRSRSTNRWLADFASAHAAATRRRGAASQMLIRVPPGARAAALPRDFLILGAQNGDSGDVMDVVLMERGASAALRSWSPTSPNPGANFLCVFGTFTHWHA